jgi:hypothetical protein
MPYNFAKDPADNSDWGFNWATLLNGDTIATSVWTVAPAGLTVGAESNTATLTTIWLAGGTLGENYTLTNTITTAGGRIFQRDAIMRIRNI